MDRKILAVLLAAWLGPLAGNMILALVPPLKADFGASGPEVLLSITFFMVPFALFMLFSGTLSDVYDRKKTLMGGFAVYTVGSLLCALSPDLQSFLASRVLQGVGYAFITPILVALLGEITPYEERGRWMGFMASATGAGVVMGPFLGGLVAEVEWRLAFVLVAGLAVAIGLFFHLAFRRDTFESREGDLRSAMHNVAYCIRRRPIIYLVASGFLAFLCYISVLSFLSDHLSLPPLDLRESEIGTIIMAAGAASVFAAPVGGRLVDSLGRGNVGMAGFAIMIGAMLSFSLASTVPGYVLSLVILGSGVALVWSSTLTLTVEVAPDLKGTSSSLFNSVRFFGYAAAPVVFAPLYTGAGMGAIFIVSGALAAGAIVLVRMIGARDE
ncbi:MAG: MFS transporter [Methanomassiliicoccales archaeon]